MTRTPRASDTPIIWSATPTPFTEKMKVDDVAVGRMVRHHLRLGVSGLFLGGTCGEGAWMTDGQRRDLIESVAQHAEGRLTLAAQVTDNSSARILDNMHSAKEAGADIVVIAPPHFLLDTTPAYITQLYVDAIRRSPLPVAIYDRGAHGAVVVPEASLREIYAEKNVILVKDSSANPLRMKLALAARARRKGRLVLLDGDEWHCVEYLAAGYDGLLLGGAIFNGFLAAQIAAAMRAGDREQAQHLQDRMTRLMWDVYGGKKITCWLKGLKHLLVEMGIFRTTRGYLNYPLTASCRRAIASALKREAAVLFP